MQLSFRFLLPLLGVLAATAPAQILEKVRDAKEARTVMTYGAKAWGAKCGTDEPQACERDARFSEWFPKGITIGDGDGRDEDSLYALRVRDSEEAARLLSRTGPAATLLKDSRGGKNLAGNDLVRHLLAARFNLAANRGREIDGKPLGRLFFAKRVHESLVGTRVRDVVGLADRALAGEFGEVPADRSNERVIDVDGDSRADLSLTDLSDALQTFNLSQVEDAKGGVLEAKAPKEPRTVAGAAPVGEDGETTERPDAPKVGTPTIGTPRPADAPKPDAPKPADAPKPDAPKVGTPKVGTPETDPAVEPARTLITFTQDEWSNSEADKLQNYILQQNFTKLFPRGLVIGDPQGIDKDDRFAIIFLTAKDLADFLPAKGRDGSLTKDAINPTESSAGAFAGELIAAKLNVLFDDRGFMPQGSGGKLGKQVFLSQVAEPLRGQTVLQVLRTAERAIAGDFGDLSQPPAHAERRIDVNGDGTADVSVIELSKALQTLNQSFKGGKPHADPFSASADDADGKGKGKKDKDNDGKGKGKDKDKGKGKK